MIEVPSTSSHFTGEMPFKVHVNFDIPLHKCQIHVNSLEKQLKVYQRIICLAKNFPIVKRSPSFSLRPFLVKIIVGKIIVRNMLKMSLTRWG